MDKSKKDHTGFRNGLLFCFHCGQSYDLHLPQPVDMATAMMKQFSKTHKDCEPTWKEWVADQSMSPEARAALWWNNGEHGRSSDTIWNIMMGNGHGNRIAHPIDPDDFKRCYKLLQAIPEWIPCIVELKELSPQWANLIANWDKLTEMYEDFVITQKDNGMHDFMQTLIK